MVGYFQQLSKPNDGNQVEGARHDQAEWKRRQINDIAGKGGVGAGLSMGCRGRRGRHEVGTGVGMHVRERVSIWVFLRKVLLVILLVREVVARVPPVREASGSSERLKKLKVIAYLILP